VIRSYHVVKTLCRVVNNNNMKKIVMPCVTYEEAVGLFNRQSNAEDNYNELININCILIGQIKEKLLLDGRGMPLENTGIILMITFTKSNLENKRCVLKTIMNDISSPLILKQPVLFRYNLNKLRFEFFDDKLRWVNPGTEVDYFDVKYFAFRRALYSKNKLYDEA
jgi:hypothetical protein